MNHQIEHETNWLGSNLVFYDLTRNLWSANFHELMKNHFLEYSDEGLRLYLKNGYMSFGQTIFKNINYTLANEKLMRDDQGILSVVPSEDSVCSNLTRTSSLEEVKDLMDRWFRTFREREDFTSVILPLSGGLDSRWMASYLHGYENLNSYTYGVSAIQRYSYEVTLARNCAMTHGINWKFIQIGDFHDYMDLNQEIYGPSMHAHSMYHIEFFQKIKALNEHSNGAMVLSGIYGDVWAGSWNFNKAIDSPKDLDLISMNYGLGLVAPQIGQLTTDLEHQYFIKNREYLRNPRFRVIAAARIKAPLIRHLLHTPEMLGYKVDSPFLDSEISMAMLRLPDAIRKNRDWQKQLVESIQQKRRMLPLNRGNNLDLYGTYRRPLSNIHTQGEWYAPPLSDLLAGIDHSPPRVGRLTMCILLLSESRIASRILPIINKIKSELLRKYANYVVIYPLSKTKF